MFDDVSSFFSSDQGSAASSGSGLIGGILDAFIGPIMANEQFQRAKHISRRGMQASAFLAQNQPSWAMEGLRRAGMNPILAAMGGGGGFANAQMGPTVNAQTPEMGSLREAIQSTVTSAKQVQMMDAEVRNARARATSEEARAKVADQRAHSEVGLIEYQMLQAEQAALRERSQAAANKASADWTNSQREYQDLLNVEQRAIADMFRGAEGARRRQLLEMSREARKWVPLLPGGK